MKTKTLTITIDNRQVEAPVGATILDVAREQEIWIPTLCWHEDLPPHGGCRMCIVEVEGMRNLPTACTTPVAEGMVIRTDTQQVQEIRQEILQLFMSEHTSSCLLCKEVECTEYSPSIRKVGVTTGCRTCPKDQQCELQDVVDRLDVHDIDFPLSYRALRVETEDPFYDRDYNLCILCGRCVRVCQDVRTADVLAFKNSGRATTIGPAWGRTHIEAGCEFCGACVSVCPTGTLSEKARKWEGKPEEETASTCSYCGVGCGVRLLRKDGQVYRSLPDETAPVNDGQLCVKGRFGVSELVHHHRRLQFPRRFELGHSAPIEWGEAEERVVKLLRDCPPDEFGMLLSPNATCEDLYVAQKFAREVMGSDNVDSSSRLFYGAAFDAYAELLSIGGTLGEVTEAAAVLCVGLDARYGRSVVNVALRRAEKQGIPLLTVHPREHGLSMIADIWLQPDPGAYAELLEALATATARGGAKTALNDLPGASAAAQHDLAARLRQAARQGLVILVGSEPMAGSENARALAALRELARHTRARVLALPAQNNLVGSLLAGAYRELLPGARPSEAGPGWTALDLVAGTRKRKVLYTMEALPAGIPRPAEAILHQNIFPPQEVEDTDLLLPAASYAETSGTYVNGEGRAQRTTAAIAPPSHALPDWMILTRLAQAMGAEGFAFASLEDIRAEMSGVLPTVAAGDREPHPLPSLPPLAGPAARRGKLKKPGRTNPFWLSIAWQEHTHRGLPLSEHVDGAAVLWRDATLEACPEDAAALGLGDGDPVLVANGKAEWVWPLRIRSEQPAGSLRVVLPQGTWSGPNPLPVSMRRP